MWEKLLEILLEQARLRWIGKLALLRIYRSGGVKACNRFNLQSGKILSILDSAELQEVLHRERFSEDDERAEIEKLLRQKGSVSEGELMAFVEAWMDSALDTMERSFWWRERGRERAKERQEKKRLTGKPQSIAAPVQELKEPPVLPQPLPPSWVFLPPYASRNLVDRESELNSLLQWVEEGEEIFRWIAEPTGRGKTYVAQALYEQITVRSAWKACWMDFSRQVVTLESLFLGFAAALRELSAPGFPSIADSKDPYAILTNASYLTWGRAHALVQLLEREKHQWLIVLDEYDLSDNLLDDFVLAVCNYAKRTKLLLIGQKPPTVLRRPEAPPGTGKRFPLDPFPPEHVGQYLATWENLRGLTDKQVHEVWGKCGNGEPGLVREFAEAAVYQSVDEMLRQDIRQWSENAKEHLDERIRFATEAARAALRAACIFTEAVERPLLEAVCATIVPNDPKEAINELVDLALLKFDRDRLNVDAVLHREHALLLRPDVKKLLHGRAAEWLEGQRTLIRQASPSADVEDWKENSCQQWWDYTHRAFSHWRKAGEPAKALALAQDLWALTKDPRLLCQQALELCEQANDAAAHALWLRRSAAFFYIEQEFDAADNHYRKSLELDRQLGNRPGQAQTEATLAWLCLQRGQFDEAADFANHSRLLSLELEDKLSLAAALHVMGLVEEAFGHFLDGLNWLTEASSLIEEAGRESEELDADIKRVRRAISMRTVLTTVGTSLLNNARRDLKVDHPNDQELANYLRHTDSAKVSAETNSLSRLLKGDDRVVFLRSQTDEGKRCAEALARHFEDAKYETRVIEVPDLTYTESRFKMRGLRSLVATLIEQIRIEKAQHRDVLINATGGFKAEIAYATLVGLLFDVPVYYIHEAFRQIIEMPPAPISWDYSLMADYEEFFEWIDADLQPTEQVDSRLRGLPDDIRLLLAEEEGYTLVSPAGEAFYKAYRDRLRESKQVAILMSARAWDVYRTSPANVQKLFARTLVKLRLRTLRVASSDRVRNSDCLVFPKGHRDERVFFFEGEDGKIRVCELTRHSDETYDRTIERGVRRDNYNDFDPWDEES